MPEALIFYERTFWRCGAIHMDADGSRRLLTDKVPGPVLLAYRVKGGEL